MQWAKQKGFTIVELLIVVVVIAILAAVTIVAYNGIANRAKVSAAQSALSQAVKKIQSYAVVNAELFPDALGDAEIVGAGKTSYQYYVNNSSSPREYCVTATFENVSYYQNNTSTQSPTAGACPGHGINGLPPNLVLNPSFETGGGLTTIRTNLHTNPSIETSTGGWGNVNGGSGAVIAQSTAQTHSGSQSLMYTYGDGTSQDSGPATSITANAGTIYTVSAWVYAPNAINGGLRMIAYGTALGNTLRGTGSTTTGSWVRLTLTVTAAASGTLSFAVGKQVSGTDTGKIIYVDSIVAEATSDGDYFSGATAASGDYVYGWSGAANVSSSFQRGIIPANYSANGSNNTRAQSTVRATDGTTSARVLLMNGAVNPGLYQGIILQPGTYTFIAKVWAESAIGGQVALTAQGTGVSVGTVQDYPVGTTTQQQWVELRRVVTVSSAGNVTFFAYIPGTINNAAGKSFWVDEYAVVSGSCSDAKCY